MPAALPAPCAALRNHFFFFSSYLCTGVCTGLLRETPAPWPRNPPRCHLRGAKPILTQGEYPSAFWLCDETFARLGTNEHLGMGCCLAQGRAPLIAWCEGRGGTKAAGCVCCPSLQVPAAKFISPWYGHPAGSTPERGEGPG